MLIYHEKTVCFSQEKIFPEKSRQIHHENNVWFYQVKIAHYFLDKNDFFYNFFPDKSSLINPNSSGFQEKIDTFFFLIEPDMISVLNYQNLKCPEKIVDRLYLALSRKNSCNFCLDNATYKVLIPHGELSRQN